jgi:hypothetical protein
MSLAPGTPPPVDGYNQLKTTSQKRVTSKYVAKVQPEKQKQPTHLP